MGESCKGHKTLQGLRLLTYVDICVCTCVLVLSYALGCSRGGDRRVEPVLSTEITFQCLCMYLLQLPVAIVKLTISSLYLLYSCN